MEVQVFTIAQAIRKNSEIGGYDAAVMGAHTFFPKNKEYPFQCRLPYFMLLRRASAENEEEITLRLNLINNDGMTSGAPNDLKAYGKFPEGHKFMTLVGAIEFVFPEEGEYRLDITADEESFKSIYSYNLEAI